MSAKGPLRSEWLAFEKDLGISPKLHGPTYDDIIGQDLKNGEMMMEKLTFPGPDTSVKTSEHRTANGIRLKSYKADTFKPDKPLIYYIHGGGFVMGSVDQDDRFLGPFSKSTGCVFVSVEYRLAPKHKYPAALDDCVEGAKWCAENAVELGAKKGPIVVFGKSAGGCLAFATALTLIDDGRGSDVLGVVSCQPITVHPEVVPEDLKSRYLSYDENAENTINTKKGMLAMMGIFGAPKDDPYISCLLHSNLKALPPVYMNACGADTLRDDARLMKELLDRNGVSNQYDEYPGLPHYFYAFPSPHLKALTEDYYSKTVKGIEWIIQA